MAKIHLYYSLFAIACNLHFRSLIHLNSSLVSATVEGGVYEYIGKSDCIVTGDDSAAEAKNIGVIVAACHFCTEIVGDDCGANASLLVCDHRHTDSGAAAEYAELAIAVGYRLADCLCIRRIVDRIGGVGAKIDKIYAALLEMLCDSVLDVKSAVIARYCYFHWFLILSACDILR